jgi:benzodiazapine receptor
MEDWMGLIASLIVCMAAAAVGGLLTAKAIKEWYRTLRKPSWNPPDWAFGPVWTILYVLMAISAWLVWEEGGLHQQIIPLSIFGIQLALNVAWSAIFFYKRKLLGGLIEVIGLWAAILATIIAFWGVSIAAAALLIPYIAWVSIASYLNYTIWRLNRVE